MENTEKIVEQGDNISAPVQKSKKDKKVSKCAIAVVILFALMAAGGIGFGVYSWMANSGRVADLERQIADRDATISELKQEEGGNERPGEDAYNLNLAKNLLITSPEQLINEDNEPVEVEIKSSFGGLSITLSRQVGGEMTLFDGSKMNKAPSLNGMINYPYLDTGWEEFEVTGIDAGKVVDVFISGFGNGMGDETAFFLMDDGTVEYMPILKAREKNDYRSYGKLPGVKNVIKFIEGELYEGGPHGALVGSFAQRADGKLYRLLDIIKETGSY